MREGTGAGTRFCRLRADGRAPPVLIVFLDFPEPGRRRLLRLWHATSMLATCGSTRSRTHCWLKEVVILLTQARVTEWPTQLLRITFGLGER